MDSGHTRVPGLKGSTPGLALENAHTLECETFFGSLSQQALVHPDFALRMSASSFTLTPMIVFLSSGANGDRTRDL